MSYNVWKDKTIGKNILDARSNYGYTLPKLIHEIKHAYCTMLLKGFIETSKKEWW